MAKLLKLRRGTTTQHGSFTGAEGEVTIDTTKDTAVVHDGSTAGGTPLAKEDMSNVSSSDIAGRLSNDSIAPSKIGSGTLPSDVTVASANLVDGTIVNADVNASAAIAGTKISPDFGSQNITTTGNVGGKNLDLVHTNPTISLTDSNNDDDFQIKVDSGNFVIKDATNNADRFVVDSNGTASVNGNLDVGAGLDVTGNITVSGTVDGRDIASLANKIDGIESNATADQTAAEIRTLVGNASDSNVFTDADHSKLDGIETGATGDQTSAEIKSLLASNNLTSAHLGVDSVTSSELANNAVDTNAIVNDAVTFDKIENIATGGIIGRNNSGTGSIERLTPAEVRAILNIENGATGDQTDAEIRAAIEAASDSNVFTDADHTKLNGIATSANLYVHPNHSGEVTSSGDGAMTIANNVVDEANLKVSNSPTNGYFLQAQSGNTGGLTWAQVAEPDLTNLSASNLTSGTIPNARFPGTLPALNGSNLTNLAASALSGTLPALDGSNLTNLASACTRVKAGIRTSEYDLPHYNQGYLDVPGTNVTFDNVSSDNVYLIYHGYQLRTTNAPNHTRTSYTVNAYISGPSHGGVGHYNVYSSHTWTSYGPFMSINAEQNTNNKTFSIKGRCSYYTHTYNSIQNVYMIVMEFKLS